MDYGMIDEHQGVPSMEGGRENYTDNYYADEDEQKTCRMVDKLLNEAKEYRKKFDEKWGDYYKFFRGDQWKEKRPSYRHSEVINLVFDVIQSQVPILTDPRPRIEFIPQEPNDREFSDIMNDVAEHDWVSGSWGWSYVEVRLDSHIFGTGLSSLEHDKEADEGLGDIVYNSEDPFECYPSPGARNVNKNAEYFIKATPMTLKQIKRKWEKGKHVKADITDYSLFDRSDLGNTRYNNVGNDVLEVEYSGRADTADSALVVYCYLLKCDEKVSEKSVMQMPDGSEQEVTTEQFKYPNGRLIVKANNIILQDGPIEYDDGKAPFQRVQNYINPRMFWGISEIEQLEGPQKMFNKLISFAMDVLTLMGNPIWIVDTAAGVDPDLLINRPGLVVPKEPGSEVRREAGVQLQPYVLQIIDRIKEWVNDLSGRTDLSRGVRPEGINSGYAIEQLMSAGQTRMRQKALNGDYYLQELGQQYLSRILQFRSSPKIYRLTGKDGAEKYFKFHVEKNQDEEGNQVYTARVRNLMQGEDGVYYYGEEKQLPLKGKLDVRVSTGSDLPFNKQAKETRAQNLFKLGVIDDEEMLKSIDYPNYEAVLERVRRKKEEMAAAAAQQAGAPPMPPPGV